MTISYSEAKQHFLKGPRGKYIKSLNTWIKVLSCENRVCEYINVWNDVEWKYLKRYCGIGKQSLNFTFVRE